MVDQLCIKVRLFDDEEFSNEEQERICDKISEALIEIGYDAADEVNAVVLLSGNDYVPDKLDEEEFVKFLMEEDGAAIIFLPDAGEEKDV